MSFLPVVPVASELRRGRGCRTRSSFSSWDCRRRQDCATLIAPEAPPWADLGSPAGTFRFGGSLGASPWRGLSHSFGLEAWPRRADERYLSPRPLLSLALTGLSYYPHSSPRASPWAGISRPFGALGRAAILAPNPNAPSISPCHALSGLCEHQRAGCRSETSGLRLSGGRQR